jgi:hypothetical protein
MQKEGRAKAPILAPLLKVSKDAYTGLPIRMFSIHDIPQNLLQQVLSLIRMGTNLAIAPSPPQSAQHLEKFRKLSGCLGYYCEEFTWARQILTDQPA